MSGHIHAATHILDTYGGDGPVFYIMSIGQRQCICVRRASRVSPVLWAELDYSEPAFHTFTRDYRQVLPPQQGGFQVTIETAPVWL